MTSHRRRSLRSALIASLVLLAPRLALGDPAGLLRAAEEADRRLSYTGVRLLKTCAGSGDAERRVRVWHQAPDRTRVEYLSPSGGDVLLESGGRRWYFSQRRGQWWPIEWRPPLTRTDLLLQNYRVRAEGEDVVAGRRVIRLKVEPRNPGNPSKRVWIDPVYKITLREEVRDSENRLTAVSAFEQFEPSRVVSAGLFEPPAVRAVRTAPPPPPFTPLTPRYVPGGYEEVRRVGLRRGPFDGVHLGYTDGLGTISLFQLRTGSEPLPSDRRRGKEGRRNGWRFGERGGQPPLSRRIGDLKVTLMGDISRDELRKMLDSLK